MPLRRLTRFEYKNTVADLLKVDASPADDLPPDEVSDGFDNNAGVLTVSALHAEKYVLVSEALAKTAVQNLAALTGCDAATSGEDACAQTFARSFGRRAFRRPTTADDEAALVIAAGDREQHPCDLVIDYDGVARQLGGERPVGGVGTVVPEHAQELFSGVFRPFPGRRFAEGLEVHRAAALFSARRRSRVGI